MSLLTLHIPLNLTALPAPILTHPLVSSSPLADRTSGLEKKWEVLLMKNVGSKGPGSENESDEWNANWWIWQAEMYWFLLSTSNLLMRVGMLCISIEISRVLRQLLIWWPFFCSSCLIILHKYCLAIFLGRRNICGSLIGFPQTYFGGNIIRYQVLTGTVGHLQGFDGQRLDYSARASSWNMLYVFWAWFTQELYVFQIQYNHECWDVEYNYGMYVE